MDRRLDALADALLSPAAASPGPPAEPGARRAAVACVFRTTEELQVLLMRRAERPGDRWSGQISFPGGHAEPLDADLAATARRETREEVGLDLAEAALLGCLPTRSANARGRRLRTTITPFVFHVEAAPPLELGPEAARAFWLPFERAVAGHLDHEHLVRAGEGQARFPAWRHEQEVVWGMTYEMLRELGTLAAG